MKNEIYTLHLFPYPLQISMASSRHIALFVEVLEVLSEASRQFKLFRSWDQTTAGDHGLNRFFSKKHQKLIKTQLCSVAFENLYGLGLVQSTKIEMPQVQEN